MKELLTQTWSWWFSGTMIAAIMFFLLYFGQSFGFSSNLRTICAAVGLGKKAAFFDFDWKSQLWNLVFLLGAIIGGFIAHQVLSEPGAAVQISPATVEDLGKLGIGAPTSLQPDELFGWNAVFSVKGFLLLAVSGLLIGFGTRYAAGCTSGHAISGLSSLQWPSLVAVVGFFIGGIIMTFLILPLIFKQ